MRKSVLVVAALLGFLFPKLATAQNFMVEDTVRATVNGVGNVESFIKNNLHTPLKIKWKVTGTDFPADWLTGTAFGICDNKLCYQNTSASWLWDPSASSGSTFTSDDYSDTTSFGTFHLSLDLSAVSAGTHWVTVTMTENGSVPPASRTTTFVINKFPTTVKQVKAGSSDVTIYPNPATNELNVVYDAASDVKNIAVYSIIGRLMTIYKVTSNTSANLNIESIPAGIYFVRLIGASGDVVTTKKFTKQ